MREQEKQNRKQNNTKVKCDSGDKEILDEVTMSFVVVMTATIMMTTPMTIMWGNVI